MATLNSGAGVTIVGSPRLSEGLHGKRDTLERDIFIGGLFSFSPIVIFVI